MKKYHSVVFPGSGLGGIDGWAKAKDSRYRGSIMELSSLHQITAPIFQHCSSTYQTSSAGNGSGPLVSSVLQTVAPDTTYEHA